MQSLISWIKNNTATIYMWIGRLTVLFALGVIIYIVVRAIITFPGFSFDPLMYVLLIVVIVFLSRQNQQISKLTQATIDLHSTQIEVKTKTLPSKAKSAKR